MIGDLAKISIRRSPPLGLCCGPTRKDGDFWAAPCAEGGACTPSTLPANDCCVLLPLPPSSKMLSTTFLSTCESRCRISP